MVVPESFGTFAGYAAYACIPEAAVTGVDVLSVACFHVEYFPGYDPLHQEEDQSNRLTVGNHTGHRYQPIRVASSRFGSMVQSS